MSQLSKEDIWLLATDRRFENLNMPILKDSSAYAAKADKCVRHANLISLPTNLPRQAQAFMDFLNQQKSDLRFANFKVQISLIYRYLASPWKYEPLNLPDVHFPVSSFGGLFSSALLLVTKNPLRENFANIYAYHANYHALEKIAEDERLLKYIGECEFAFIGVGEYWSVAKKYGEYAPYGVALDVGIVNAQLSYLLSLFDWRVSALDINPEQINQILSLSDECASSLFCLKAQGLLNVDLEFLDNSQSQPIACLQSPTGLFERFEHLKSITDFFSAYPKIDEQINDTAMCAEQRDELTKTEVLNTDLLSNIEQNEQNLGLWDDFFQVLRRRTAANDGWGFSQISSKVDDSYLQTFIQVRQQLSKCRSYLPGEESLHLAFAWINSYGPASGLYNENGLRLSEESSDFDTNQFIQTIRDCLYSDRQKYNLSSMMLELFISVDINKANQLHGCKSIRNAHLAAGAVVHDCCTAAAALGLFARPVRMFRDHKLESRLNLQGQLLIQVLVGKNRHTNFSMSLL